MVRARFEAFHQPHFGIGILGLVRRIRLAKLIFTAGPGHDTTGILSDHPGGGDGLAIGMGGMAGDKTLQTV